MIPMEQFDLNEFLNPDDRAEQERLIEPMVSSILNGCSHDIYLNMRCCRCGSKMNIIFHPDGNFFFLSCFRDSGHFAQCADIDILPSWWSDYIDNNWSRDIRSHKKL